MDPPGPSVAPAIENVALVYGMKRRLCGIMGIVAVAPKGEREDQVIAAARFAVERPLIFISSDRKMHFLFLQTVRAYAYRTEHRIRRDAIRVSVMQRSGLTHQLVITTPGPRVASSLTIYLDEERVDPGYYPGDRVIVYRGTRLSHA